jgi:hypothetical protein
VLIDQGASGCEDDGRRSVSKLLGAVGVDRTQKRKSDGKRLAAAGWSYEKQVVLPLDPPLKKRPLRFGRSEFMLAQVPIATGDDRIIDEVRTRSATCTHGPRGTGAIVSVR